MSNKRQTIGLISRVDEEGTINLDCWGAATIPGKSVTLTTENKMNGKFSKQKKPPY